ncbi:MAG: hypothetical protein Q9169_002250 [Polycauliona sp. 2 TL-2023]
MGDYHDALRKLEELAETRLELKNSGARYTGIEKMINIQIVQLHAKRSLTSKADQYTRRLKAIKEQLEPYIVEDMAILIATQESLVPDAAPSNISKVRRIWRNIDALGLTGPQVRTSQWMAWTKSPRSTSATPHVRWKNEVPAVSSIDYRSKVTSPWHKTSPHKDTSSSAKKLVSFKAPMATRKPTLITPTIRPAPFFMFVNSVTTREKKYLNKISGNPFQIRVGGNKTDEHSDFSHHILSSPEKIGVVLWSRESNLIVVHSKNYIQYVTGDVLHIEALDDVEALRFAEHVRQQSFEWDVKVLESNGRYLSDTLARGTT